MISFPCIPSLHLIHLQIKVARVLSGALFRNPSDWGFGFGDVKLTITTRDGFIVSMGVHRKVLASRTQFFKEKLGRRTCSHHWDSLSLVFKTQLFIHIDVCDALKFNDGISSCLEYLEVVPWSEEEEERVISNLNELNLHNDRDVLQRVTLEPSTFSRINDILLRLLTEVLQAKDEKAHKDIETLIFRLVKLVREPQSK
ncbi:hypothetical protein L2E82_37043 [Cichorium intybus]|uniref:Uncharacterized protein n=1 Tax=Cichorium intybus TaxID=13427 RepID=A0ACB9AEA5_CICIN|nr:hypothetical protein L2E82_37043 [Cichorium intybus]